MVNQRVSAIILVAAMATAISAVVFTSGILFDSTTITNQGNVNSIGVGVYWEDSCLNEVTSINWGYVEPGSDANVTIYIKNDGNVPMTLNMTTGAWDPSSASTYITFSWNCEGSQVNGGAVLEATLFLSVSSNATGMSSFTFEITITGTD